jgi:hypothetical protein
MTPGGLSLRAGLICGSVYEHGLIIYFLHIKERGDAMKKEKASVILTEGWVYGSTWASFLISHAL